MPYTELVPPPAYEDMSSRSNNSRRQEEEDPMMDPLLASSSAALPGTSSSLVVDHHHHHHQDPSDRSASATAGGGTTRRRHQHHYHHQGRILDRDADFFQSRGRWSGVELMPRESGRRNRSYLSVGYHHQNRRYGNGRNNNFFWFGGCCCCCNWIAIKRQIRQWLPLLWDDWFHTLAYQRTLALMLILFVTYFGIVIGFGFIYLAVSILGAEKTKQSDGSYVTTSFCDMDINDHMEALYFSLSTMTTIGYGVSDYYFGGCWTPLLLVLCQVCTAITFDAVAVGLLFTRLSRGRKRSKTIVVSNQAVVQVVQGIPYFMFRVGELRRFPLMGASVRVFCIRHERIPRVYPSPTNSTTSPAAAAAAVVRPPAPSNNNLTNKDTTSVATGRTATTAGSHSNTNRGIPVETTHFVTRAMKLLHPDETLMHTNNILMSLPQVIVHRMDDKSPLMPPSEWYDGRGHQHTFPLNKDNRLDVQSQIQDFWRDRGIEIVVLVEGIDELTGTSVQTRHSYCTSYRNDNNNNNNALLENTSDANANEEEGDVAWNRAFVNCVFPFPNPSTSGEAEENDDEDDDDDLEGQGHYYPHLNRVCAVDFARFHDTVPTPLNCLASPHVPY